MVITGCYFDGRQSRAQTVQFAYEHGSYLLLGSFGEKRYLSTQVEVSLVGGQRLLTFPDGGSFEVDNTAEVDELFDAAQRHLKRNRSLKKKWSYFFVGLIFLLIGMVGAYFWLLPPMATWAANHVPASLVDRVSDIALTQMEQSMQPTQVPLSRQKSILAALAKYPSTTPETIIFRQSSTLGANAMALPNGNIILLDGLVALTKDDEDIVAVLLHERGHVLYRHGVRQIMQSAVVTVVMSTLLGDVSSVGASLSMMIAQSRYSRDFERQADRYAGLQLLQQQQSPERLVHMLLLISKKSGEGADKSAENKQSEIQDSAFPTIFSTHPDIGERISLLRDLERTGK